MKLNIIVCGVGGQGNLLASNAIANYAMDKGYTVFGTETIGSAQRGGSVVSHLRISTDAIHSPLVPVGSADVIMGFEPVEALRNIKLANPEGTFVINSQPIPTVLNNMGMETYPSDDEIIGSIREKCPKGHMFNATKKAAELGNTLMTNVIMLGALTKTSSFFEKEAFKQIILNLLPAKVRAINDHAFEVGYDSVG